MLWRRRTKDCARSSFLRFVGVGDICRIYRIPYIYICMHTDRQTDIHTYMHILSRKLAWLGLSFASR